MAQEQETNNNQAEVSTTKLVVRGNILAFDSTVFQISNISTVSVKEIVKITHHERSLTPFFWVIFGGCLIWLWKDYPGFQEAIRDQITKLNWSEDIIGIAAVVNFLFIIGSIIQIFSFEKTTTISRTFLSVEMNSGNQTLFTSNDKGFMLRAASALTSVMSQPRASDEKIVSNFDNKTINVGKAENSNIIGGNVTDSIVSSI